MNGKTSFTCAYGERECRSDGAGDARSVQNALPPAWFVDNTTTTTTTMLREMQQSRWFVFAN